MAELRLEAREFRDLTTWRWLLTDANGRFLADHKVRLNPASWQFEAFENLRHYVSWLVAPDQGREGEARIVAGVGAWAGIHVLGPSVADALVQATISGPVTVRVIVPSNARDLLLRPLELAHVHGRPLARQDITLVMQAGNAGGLAPAGSRLRVLGLFTLPEGGSPLNLRRERHDLVRLIGRIAASGKAADVRVLQYGVTRDRLRGVLDDAEGWDVIHISGHGAPGRLLLETAAGSADLVTASELADILAPARGRVRLVILSACWSAADAAADQRGLLGLPAAQDHNRYTERISGDPPSPGALAPSLAERLGCAVLAMRFPVDDEFAIALSGELYRLLAVEGQPLPRAVGQALRKLRQGEYPALSVAAPAIFGETAVGLTLPAPPRQPGEDDDGPRPVTMAGFPPQPDRFVGRTGVMARSSAALATESGLPGVLLHGMPGGGKTACALELAYTHEHSFDSLVWYKAPDEGMAIDGALTDFALSLERGLPGFLMAGVLADARKLTAFGPRLTELLGRNRILLIIDNAESLLTETGQWRDDRWGQVIAALTAHAGSGRLILTSRRLPAKTTGLAAETVDALSMSEGLLLARELPNLRALVDRGLARGVLAITQGHPKLLELADGQAADPKLLARLIDSGEQAWRDQGGIPDGFFTVGESSAGPEDYLSILATWTRVVTEALAPAERDLFHVLCCLEEPDRERSVIDSIWPAVLTRLGRGGDPPDPGRALAAVTARGLAAPDGRTGYCAIHPAVASAGRDHAGQVAAEAVDAEAAEYMGAAFWAASGGDDEGTMHTGTATRTARSAVPYMMRQQEWMMAAVLTQQALNWDPTRANAAALLPALEQIARHCPQGVGMLAQAVQVIDPATGETRLRDAMNAAADSGDFQSAWVAAGHLMDQCRTTGRLAEALALADRKRDLARRAGLGPWTQLSDEGQRLQVLVLMGQARQVLAEAGRLRDRMQDLPVLNDPPGEAADPWNVREIVLNAGAHAAMLLSRWDNSLALNAEHVASMRDRHAPAAEIARVRFSAYGPLVGLHRGDEALDLLRECRQVFEDANDIAALGKVLGALASIEDDRGHGDAAVHLERDALRYRYFAGDVTGIVISYHNLGRHLRQPARALASDLTAALIGALIGIDTGVDPIYGAAIDLYELGESAVPPADVSDLCRRVGDIPGTDPMSLITRLAPDAAAAERALHDLIARATKQSRSWKWRAIWRARKALRLPV